MPVIKKGPPIARHVLYVRPQYREAIAAFFGPLGNQSACTILLRNLGPVQKAISLNLAWISGKSRNKILSIRLRMMEFCSH